MPYLNPEHAIVATAALWLALAIDHWLGEPPARLHPVVWMGRYLGWVGSSVAPHAYRAKPVDLPMFFIGALTWCVGAAMRSSRGWLRCVPLMPGATCGTR